MEHVWHIWDRAPLLRYINPRSEWHHLSPPTSGVSVETTDGVFANLTARPSCSAPVEQTLPTYDETLEDPVPPYWESQVQASWGDEVYVDGLPVGSILSVVWTAIVATTFQFIGFVITYLLHTSHGSRAGSQIGLAITLVNLGFSAIPLSMSSESTKALPIIPQDPAAIDFAGDASDGIVDSFKSSLGGKTNHNPTSYSRYDSFVAYGLVVGGVFIASRALWDFYRAKKLEYNALAGANENTANTASSTTPPPAAAAAEV